MAAYPVLRKSPYAGMLVNGQGRPINLDGPAPTMHASMGGNKTPIIDLVQLRDPTAEPWVMKYHRSIMSGDAPGQVEPPDYWRRITVREAARIQAFPDTFTFSGSRGSQFSQVGNAVPALMAKAVASTIRECMLTIANDPEVDDVDRSNGLQIPFVV
jgi:DNA (cytosine-5)-methyltransferase 1